MSRSYSGSKGLHIALWVAQVLLFVAFLMAGGMKLVTSAEALAQQGNQMPMLLVRFIGVAEVAGALGMILPAATRIKPFLTTWAAIGLLTIMVLAAGLHASRAEWSGVGTTVILGALAAFVVWGRRSRCVIAPRDVSGDGRVAA